MLYLDASALVKLVVPEDESVPLRAYLSAQPDRLRFSSMLAHSEVLRAVRSAGAAAMVTARDVLATCYLVDVTRDVLERAGTIDPGTALRTLDAIHLVTAAQASERLTAVITYDDRMTRAAQAFGFPVVAPR